MARILAEKSYAVDVFEKENQIGGNLVEDNVEGTIVHLHGPHIFHTNSDEIWNFVNRFSKFEPYFHRVSGFIKGKSIQSHLILKLLKFYLKRVKQNFFKKINFIFWFW